MEDEAQARIGLRVTARVRTTKSFECDIPAQTIVDADEDAAIDPAEIYGFASYGDDKNQPVRLMPDLGTRVLCCHRQVFCIGHLLGRTELKILTEEWFKRMTACEALPDIPHYYGVATVMEFENLPLRWAVKADPAPSRRSGRLA